jgi:hypothetical protein
MDASNAIANDLFYKIRSRFSGLKLGTETGEITINPEDARFFDFDYMEGEKPVGHVSISLAEPNSMKVYFSSGITESMDQIQKNNWYGFLKELRQFAKRRLLAFDTRDIAKDNLDKRDYAFLSQNNKPQITPNIIQNPVGESVMSESAMYGTKTMSFQKLMDTRLIIKHSQALNDDLSPGARTRNISALFVENQDGERFKYPFIHLAGARAMQRHVANGGLPYDDIGKSIVQMSEELAQLKSFSNYVVRNDLMNSDTNNLVERSRMQLEALREKIYKLSKQSHYEQYKESFQAQQPIEVPEDVIEDYTEKFTVRNFKEDIKSVFPVLYRLMQEENTIGYDDIVAMTTESEIVNDEAEIQFENDPMENFESWVMALGEESAIMSQDQEERQAALDELQNLVGEHFPAGPDGNNAIEALKGIIDDPALFAEIKEAGKTEPDTCVRPLVKDWLEENAPDVLDEIDFGDMVDEPDDNTDDAEALASAGHGSDEDYGTFPESSDDRTNKLNTRTIAEFIHSFYDKESGTFPKGPEGVCTMVGKKFGEQAEQVARKFVERMAPQQTTDNNPELQELARVRELAGLEKKNLTTTESSSQYYDYDIEEYETEVTLVFDRDNAGNPTNIKVMLGKADITPVVDQAWLDETVPEIPVDEQSPSTGYIMDLDIGINYSIYGSDRPATREEPPEYAELEINDSDVLGNGKTVSINLDDLGSNARENIEQDLWDDARDRAEDDRDYYDPPYESQENFDDLSELSRSTVKSYAGKKMSKVKDRGSASYYDREKMPELEKDLKGLKGAQDRLKGKKPTSENSELESIKRLSGISQGLGI